MDSKIRAICNCGFKKVLKIETGRFAYLNGSLIFPCYCKNCGDLVEIYLDEGKLNCPICTSENILPYDYKDIGEKGSHTLYHKYSGVLKRGVELTNGNYKCPHCKKMTLSFLPPLMMVD